MALPAIAWAAGGWLLGKAFQGGNVVQAVRDIAPSLEQEAQVTVYGNPASRRDSLYWQAVAIAFGLIRRRDIERLLPPAGMIILEYSPTHNQVTFTVRQNSPWQSVAATMKEAGNDVQLFTGPKNSIQGGPWQWNAKSLPRFPGKITALGFDLSGWEVDHKYVGRTMITPEPVYKDALGNNRISESPKPPGDHVSRGLPTIAAHPSVRTLDPSNWYTNPEYLLFTALAGPCNHTTQFFDTDLKSRPPHVSPKPTPDAELKTTPDPQKPNPPEVAPPPRPITYVEGVPFYPPIPGSGPEGSYQE